METNHSALITNLGVQSTKSSRLFSKMYNQQQLKTLEILERQDSYGFIQEKFDYQSNILNLIKVVYDPKIDRKNIYCFQLIQNEYCFVSYDISQIQSHSRILKLQFDDKDKLFFSSKGNNFFVLRQGVLMLCSFLINDQCYIYSYRKILSTKIQSDDLVSNFKTVKVVNQTSFSIKFQGYVALYQYQGSYFRRKLIYGSQFIYNKVPITIFNSMPIILNLDKFESFYKFNRIFQDRESRKKISCAFQSTQYLALGQRNGNIIIYENKQREKDQRYNYVYVSTIKNNLLQFCEIYQIITIRNQILVALYLNKQTNNYILRIWSLKYNFSVHQKKLDNYRFNFVADDHIFIFVQENFLYFSIVHQQKRKKQILMLQDKDIKIISAKILSKNKSYVIDQFGRKIYLSNKKKLEKVKEKQNLHTINSINCSSFSDFGHLIVKKIKQLNTQYLYIIFNMKQRSTQYKFQFQNTTMSYILKNGCLFFQYSKLKKNKKINVLFYNPEIHDTEEIKFQVDFNVYQGPILFSIKKKILYFGSENHQLYVLHHEVKPNKIIKLQGKPKMLEINDDQSVLYIGFDHGIKCFDIKTELWFSNYLAYYSNKVIRITRDLILTQSRIKKDRKQQTVIYQISDHRWRQSIFKRQFNKNVKCQLNSQTNLLTFYDEKNVFTEKLHPKQYNKLEDYFSLNQIITLKAIAKGHCTKQQAFQLLDKHQLLHFYFNAAILFGQVEIVQIMLRKFRIIRPDKFILRANPINYAVKSGNKEIASMLMKKCQSIRVYPHQFMNSKYPESMAQFLIGQFAQIKSKQLPSYGTLKSQPQPLFSSTPSSYLVNLEKLKDYYKSSQQQLRLIQLNTAIDVQNGSSKLIQLLQCYYFNVSQQLYKSDAALLIHYLYDRNFKFYIATTVARLAITILNIISIYMYQQIQRTDKSASNYQKLQNTTLLMTKIGTAFLFASLYLQIKGYKSIESIFRSKLFYLNFFLPMVVIANNMATLLSGPILILNFVAMVFLLAGFFFSLLVFRQINYQILVIVEIIIRLIPLILILAFCILTISTNVFLSKGSVWEQMRITTFRIFFSKFQQQYFSCYDNQNCISTDEQRVIKYIQVFLCQLLLSVFLLNGVMVGTVSGIYQNFFQSKQLIGFQQQIQQIIRHQILFKELVACTFYFQKFLKPKPVYLHALLTNKIPSKIQSANQGHKQEVSREIEHSQSKVNQELNKVLKLATAFKKSAQQLSSSDQPKLKELQYLDEQYEQEQQSGEQDQQYLYHIKQGQKNKQQEQHEQGKQNDLDEGEEAVQLGRNFIKQWLVEDQNLFQEQNSLAELLEQPQS